MDKLFSSRRDATPVRLGYPAVAVGILSDCCVSVGIVAIVRQSCVADAEGVVVTEV